MQLWFFLQSCPMHNGEIGFLFNLSSIAINCSTDYTWDDSMTWALFVSVFAVSNHDLEFSHQSGYRIKRLRILPVQSGLWHSLLSAQWPRHSDPPWAAAEHCLVLCWVPLAQVTEQSLQELHSCHCPSTEAPTTTQQACPKWREKEGRQKWGEIFRSLFSLRSKANKTDIKRKEKNEMTTWRFW